MKPLRLGIAGLLAGCATTASPPPGAEWLVGTWLMMAPGIEHPLACASGLPIRYEADGSYALMEESGTWRLDGERLIETATEVNEAGDGDSRHVGRPFTSRIERTGPDAFRKTFADGSAETFRRCPPAR